MLQRYKKVDEICVFDDYKKYTFLHISIRKRYIIHYKSIVCRIITQFLHNTLLYKLFQIPIKISGTFFIKKFGVNTSLCIGYYLRCCL